MAEEINDEIPYLTALKKSAIAEAAKTLAVALAPEAVERYFNAAIPAPTENEQYNGAEKRRTPRYKCEGGVRLAEDGCDVHTWARFTDVSLHGCYVEAQATYAVGTSLNMKMELNGVRLETKGIVRVNYPYLGMGIAFVDMSEENQERLRELLRTVTYPRVVFAPGDAAVMPTGVISTSPSTRPEPVVPNPGLAMQALAEFFQNRCLLTREDFLNIVTRSQVGEMKR
jgi:hypothetical protein